MTFTPAGTGSNTATYDIAIPLPGRYRVSITWFPDPNRATNTPVSVYNGTAIPTNLLTTVLINQEVAPNDFSESGAVWEDLGIFAISGAILAVQLTDNANEYVIADGVRVQRVGDLPTLLPMDDGDNGFTTTGVGWTSTTGQGYKNDVTSHAAGTGANTATWACPVVPGLYQVSVTWFPDPNRATNAPFTVLDGSTSLGTVLVNQELTPGDFTDAGVGWMILGTYNLTGTTLNVRLTDNANEYVVADGVRIEKVTRVTVNDFGNVTRFYYDGISRRVESKTMLTVTGQGNGTFIGATLEGVKETIPGSYLDIGNSGDGLISTYFAYDDNSQLLARRDDNGNTTAYIYDNQNRTKIERRGLNETGLTFTIMGGDSGSFNVVLRGGVLVQNTEPGGTDISNDNFDRDSNVLSRRDEAGNVFNCTFDALNRQKTCSIIPTTGFIGTTALSWEFDGLSRQTVSTDNNDTGGADDVTTQVFYDSLSRKVEETQKIGSLPVRATSFNYDIAASGSVYQLSAAIYPDGRQVNSTYDTLDRLISRRDNVASSAIGTYQYLGSWRVAVLTYQNNTRLTHLAGTADAGFDDLRRVVNHRWESFTPGVTALGAGSRVVEFGHKEASGAPAYDRANNKKIEEKLHDTGNSEVYTYQSDYQLRSFNRGTLNAAKTAVQTLTTTAGALQSQTWALDGLGNWTSDTQTIGGVAVAEGRGHSDFNELSSRTRGGVDGGVAASSHDGNGNLVESGLKSAGGQTFPGGGLRLQYDALNRLRKAYDNNNTPGNVLDDVLLGQYSYDAGNRRLRSVTAAGTTDYYYDGWRVVEEHDAADTITQQYVYGNDLDEVWTLDNRRGGITVAQLNDVAGSQRHFYHSNTLGSVYGLTDETSALKEAYQYDAYGRQTVIMPGSMSMVVQFTTADMRLVGGASVINNPYLFTGQRLDAETKLDYYKNRYYSTDLGRFIQRDLDGYTAGDSNLYRYVANGPTNFRVCPIRGVFHKPLG